MNDKHFVALSHRLESFLNSEDVSDPRGDLVKASEALNIIPLLEMAAAKISLRSEIGDLTDAEFKQLFRSFLPTLGYAIMRRRMDWYNEAVFGKNPDSVSGKTDNANAGWDALSGLEKKRRPTH